MSTTEQTPAAASGTITIGGDLTVYRLGFGAMRITGNGVWGPPPDKNESLGVLRRAVELGVNLIDTADSYGPAVSEDLIAQALYPYPAGLIIATKGGFMRTGPNQWVPNGRPAHLRQVCEDSLRRLRLEQIDLYQLHRIDPQVPADETLGTLADLQKEGKIRHIGLSEVSVDQLAHARTIVPIVSVQNRYNLTDRASEDVLNVCEQDGLAFIPWFPLGAGTLTMPGGLLEQVARAHNATIHQIAIAWLLKRSPVMLPIPGTNSVAHLGQNVASAQITLTDEEFALLDK